jgi:hypothetical protein
VKEGREGRDATGLDDDLHAGGQEGHGAPQLQVADGEDAFRER